MSESDWRALVVAGRQAEHQALELLRLAQDRDAWEWTLPDVVRMHRWALAVLAEPGGAQNAVAPPGRVG